MSRWVLLALVVSLVGCDEAKAPPAAVAAPAEKAATAEKTAPAAKADEETPADAFRAFVNATAQERYDDAWSRLSEGTRASADQLAANAADRLKAAGLPVPTGQELLFGKGGVELVRDLDRVEIARQEGPEATVVIVDAEGNQMPVDLLLEAGQWRVVLPL